MKKSRFSMVDELIGRHRGCAIWISGSDPSMATYPDVFFDEKIGITLHLAHLKFPRATYRYTSEYDRSKYLKGNDPLYLSQSLISAWPLYGYSRKATRELFEDFKEVYFHHRFSYPPNGVRGEIRQTFTDHKVAATINGKSHIWGAHGTCLHTAFYMALLMGASEIHIIGCGHGTYEPGVEHFSQAGAIDVSMRPTYPSFTNPTNIVPVIEQTIALISATEKAGTRVFWHRRYTPELDDFVIIDLSWLEAQKRLIHRKVPLHKQLYRFFKRPVYNIISRI